MPPTLRPPATADRFAGLFGTSVVPRQQALAAGFTAGEIRACMSRGLLVAPRRGLVQLAQPDPSTADDEQRAEHLHKVVAALISVGHEAFATHESAAMVLGSARPDVRAPDAVQLAAPGVQDFSGPGVVVRGSEIPSRFLTVHHGIPVTDLRRTAVDLARGRRLPSALIPLDDAARSLVALATGTQGVPLRRAVLDPQHRRAALRELDAAVRSVAGWPGVVAARRALEHANPAAESPLESRSRGWFLEAGLPPLEIGVPVVADGRTYWADFLSREHRVIGEADGLGKYGSTIEDVRRSLAAEKARQADLEAEGWRVIRWTSTDDARNVVHRMRSALRRD